ncbi:MAG: TatD family hydrolase [Magnetococcus sp. DMHC-6]
MIDTHCHLHLPAFDTDRQEVLARSRQAGVDQWVVPGIRLSDFPQLVARHEEGIHLAFGLHPFFTQDHPTDGPDQLINWVRQYHPLAIGEIGLDFIAPQTTHQMQLALFTEQLRIADQFHLPVLLHVRKAHDIVLGVLRQRPFPFGGIVHAFSGTLHQARSYIELGFCLGFGGVVTRDNARHLRDLVPFLPESALVLESDAPDLPPAGHLGERNEPCHLPLVAQTLATLRKVPIEHMITTTRLNAQRVLWSIHGMT